MQNLGYTKFIIETQLTNGLIVQIMFYENLLKNGRNIRWQNLYKCVYFAWTASRKTLYLLLIKQHTYSWKGENKVKMIDIEILFEIVLSGAPRS